MNTSYELGAEWIAVSSISCKAQVTNSVPAFVREEAAKPAATDRGFVLMPLTCYDFTHHDSLKLWIRSALDSRESSYVYVKDKAPA